MNHNEFSIDTYFIMAGSENYASDSCLVFCMCILLCTIQTETLRSFSLFQ